MAVVVRRRPDRHNLATAAVVLGLARRAGAGGEELGLSPGALPVGLAVGLAGAGVVLAALAAPALVHLAANSGATLAAYWVLRGPSGTGPDVSTAD